MKAGLRIRAANGAPVNGGGRWVLYWMTAARRTRSSFALDRAIAWARELERPLVVLEALRAGYPYASDRLHAFVLQGMADNAARFEGAPVLYHPYVERAAGEGSGLLEALAADACVIVADDWPCFFLPRMLAAAARRLPVKMEAVDSAGLVPMRAAGRLFTTAFSFRTWLAKNVRAHLAERPKGDPLSRLELPRLSHLPREITSRWPRAPEALLEGTTEALAALPIDHGVAVTPFRGGSAEAARRAKEFLDRRLAGYAEDRNHPDDDAGSGLSPWLHFGQLSSHDLLAAVLHREGVSHAELLGRENGQRGAFFGLSTGAEAFLEQLLVWREIGFNFCAERQDAASFASLPDWARRTLAAHAGDPRPAIYGADALRGARTSDELWNAAQRQLAEEGRIHNYLRMLWGKRILEWTPTPEDALAVMIELNDRLALDGRDPNSYSGIGWVLGRYDRPWGPERPIFGTVRYMTSASARKKLRVRAYLDRWQR